jgi:hypothetical protein
MVYEFVSLEPLIGEKKKYEVTLKSADGKLKKIKFGDSGYEDYTKHKDDKRKELYLSRHESREDWTKTGITTAGFWSRWLLWNKRTIGASLNDIKKRFF